MLAPAKFIRIVIALAVVASAAGLMLAGAVRDARAEDLGNHLYDKYQVNVSGSLLWFTSKARVDTDDGSIGTDIDLESALGMEKNKFQPRADLRWRPGRHHELQLGYQFARREAQKTLDQTIDLGDTTFYAGADIHSVFDSDNLFLTYRYAFFAKDNWQAGLGLGLGAFFFKYQVDALFSGSSSTGQSGSVEYSQERSFTGPTAALGAYGRIRSGDRWYFSPDIRWLRVTVDRFTGKVFEGGLGVQYYVSPKVGIEAGYGIRAIAIEVGPRTDGGGLVDVSLTGRVRYDENHAALGVTYAF